MAAAQNFSCPNGEIDVMKYFAMEQAKRSAHFISGKPDPIYTEVFPTRILQQQDLVLAKKPEGVRIRR